MKLISLAALALLGLVSVDQVAAIDVMKTKKSMGKVTKATHGDKNMISVGLTQTEYKNNRYDEYMKPLSSESNLALAQSLGLKTTKNKEGHIQLIQNDPHHRVDNEMVNIKNMGYEGSFWFGQPSQQLQVIFDTGSAWAWVFSETCGEKDKQCPTRSKKFHQSESKGFKINTKSGQKLQYGRGAIAGHPSEDKGCFSPDENSCMAHFNFLTVVKGKDLESLKGSGLIGVAPTPSSDKGEFTDPLKNGIAGFIAQLKHNDDYNKEFDQVFSIYLSNDGKTPGDISFGGYDLEKYAKKGAEIIWADQSSNEAYWAVNTQNVNMGGQKITSYNQQVIFDNGMSLAMAPEKSFVEVIKILNAHGLKCQETQPVWMCQGQEDKMGELPSIELNLLLKQTGETKVVKMPPQAYIRQDSKHPDRFFLLLSPWKFMGLGGKDGEEYWVMGAQFMQNYYSIFDFKNKQVGLVESKTSAMSESPTARQVEYSQK